MKSNQRMKDERGRMKAKELAPTACASSSILHSSLAPRRAFTLVELMIAVALVLVLMIGVSQVFSLTSAAVSAGQSLSDAVRADRSAQSVFFNDFRGAAYATRGAAIAPSDADAPFILLRSRTQFAWRNNQDRISDGDGNWATADLDGDGTEDTISSATYNFRNHRQDIFSFFSRGVFPRQTGGNVSGSDPFVASMSGNEAWIWYGHLWLPDAAGGYTTTTFPGGGTQATNPNNYYATQWQLGRVAMILREPVGTPPQILSPAGAAQIYYARPTGAPAGNLAPLQYNSPSSTAGYGLWQARYDLAGTSIAGFRQILEDYIAATPNGPWWNLLMLGGDTAPPVGRFQADPFFAVPPTSESVAKQVPIFVPGCTQFIVEFAGDYAAQQNDPAAAGFGDITGHAYAATPARDGRIDYIVTDAATNQTRIRWYGMPRNVDTSDDTATGPVIRGVMGLPIGPAAHNLMRDVVPLRDVLMSAGSFAPPVDFFERTMEIDFVSMRVNYAAAAGGMTATERYTAAWGPNDLKPQMIRITMVVDDPQGRIQDGLTYEYVFALP